MNEEIEWGIRIVCERKIRIHFLSQNIVICNNFQLKNIQLQFWKSAFKGIDAFKQYLHK